MNGYIDPQGNYYEGDKINPDDMDVPRRPGPSYIYSDGEWQAGPSICPAFVTMRQARLALLQAELLDDVSAAISALPSPQKEAAQIEWDYSSTVERDRPLVLSLSAALGMTTEQMDELFSTAATL